MEFEKVKSVLENLSDSELLDIWNEYCRQNGYDDCEILDMYMFDEFYNGLKPSEILNKVNSDFDINDDYFVCGCYGCESFNMCDVIDHIYIDDLARHIVNNNETFDNAELEELIEEDENEDEEDGEQDE